MSANPTIAVTGLHRGQTPQPGCGVIRGLRAAMPGCRIVGLIYDPLESGVYEPGLVDRVWTMPYPSNGSDRWLDRLAEVHAASPLDLLVPDLDSEIEMLLPVRERLDGMGIRSTLPDPEAFENRHKEHLPELCRRTGVPHPRTRIVRDPSQLADAARDLGFPLVVKGRLYGAEMSHSPEHLRASTMQIASVWGYPVLLQKTVRGEEYNIAGVGDGRGGVTGMVALRKCLRSPEGKGLGGITVADPALDRLTRSLLSALRWSGPFELELMRDEDSGAFHVIEINPRFPAWIELAVALGCNLPAAAARHALGLPVEPLPPVDAGAMFVRHSVELLARVSDLGALSTDGSWIRNPN